MKTTSDRRTFLTRAALATASVSLGVGAVATGCGLRKAALPSRTFMLKGPVAAPVADGAATGAPTGVLLVRPFRVATAFDSRSFVVRRSESEYVTDAYHAFLVSPGAMLTDLVADWVRSLRVFATVTTGGSQLAPTHALEADITELYADYRDGAALKAVLAGQFRLLHPLMGGVTPMVWQHGGAGPVSVTKADPDALVAGWEQALADWCRGLERMLRQRTPMVGGSSA